MSDAEIFKEITGTGLRHCRTFWAQPSKAQKTFTFPGLGALHTRMAAARKRSPSCEVLAETRLAEPRISTNDADLRVSVGLSAGFASTALTANTELPMFSRLTSNR